MSRMTKIKKISTAWFVVLSFVLQLVYPLAPVEVQAAEMQRIELGNPDNPITEAKGWASKPNKRFTEYQKGYKYIYDMAKDLGYGDLSKIDSNKWNDWNEKKKAYEWVHPWNTVRAQQLGTTEYDHDTVDTSNGNSWTGMGGCYVRRTEIVPEGDVPKSKLTNRYVMDDGTFVPPTEALKTIELDNLPGPGLGAELPRPVFSFMKNHSSYDWTRAKIDDVIAQYLPKSGHGEAAVYTEKTQYNSPYLYYCINVNSYDASRIPGRYFLQSGKYSSQSNFRDIPEIPFILMEIGKILGINKMSALNKAAACAAMAQANDVWYAEYKHIFTATGEELNKPSAFIPELTNGEIQKMLYRVLTIEGDPVINGKKYRIQADRGDSHPDALEPLIKNAGTSEDDRSGSFVMGIEYAFSHYAIGMPIDEVDRLEVEGVGGTNKTYANKYYARALVRLFVAYTEAAREKGILDRFQMRSELEAEVVRKQKKEGKTELTIRLTNVKGAKKVEAVIPNELTLVEPANCTSRAGTAANANKTIYTLPAEANVNNTYDIKVSFDKAQITDANKQLDFAVYKRQNVIGRVWAPRGCYKYDKESGHWIVLEYVHTDKDGTENTTGFLHGQQLVSFTDQEEDIRTSVRFDVTNEPIPSLSTMVVVDDGKLEGTDTKPATIEGVVTQPVKVKDRISYKNLECDATYEVETTLNKIDANGIAVPVSSPAITYQKTPTDSPEGTWEIDLGVHNLKPGEKYVIFEKATLKKIGSEDVDPNNPGDIDEELLKPIEHKNPNDLAQTVAVVVPKGDMRTTVIGNGKAHEEGKVAVVSGTSIKVTDTIDYTNLIPNETYTITGTLMEIQGPTVTPIATKSIAQAAITSNGKWELTFDESDTTNLKPGVKYVVYEEAVSENEYLILENDKLVYKRHTVTHQDPNDVSQTLVNELEYSGKIMTTVSTDKQSAVLDEDNPDNNIPLILQDETVEAGVPVKDTVKYKDLLPNTEYTMHGRLMHILEQDGSVEVEVVTDANGSPVEAEAKFTTGADGTGSVVIDFGVVKTMDTGEKYVVYERAESEYDFGFINKDTNEVEWKKHIVSHENPYDQAQTILAGRQSGRIRTIVVANECSATFDKRVLVPLASATDGVRVQDHVAYEGLFGNKEFKLVGTLMHIKVGGEAVPIKTVEKMVKTNASGTSNKGWEIDFGNVKGLKAGEKYVVYERATSVDNLVDTNFDGVLNAPQIAKHENPNAESQTFVIEVKDTDGTLRTTVSANDKKANETKPVEVTIGETEQGVHVVDTIDYEGLVPGEVYKVETTLMHVPEIGEIQPVSGTSILVNECTADVTGKGTWTIDFGVVKGLQAGQRYVVYEEATSKNNLIDEDLDDIYERPHKVEHKDPRDASQTIVVDRAQDESRGNIRTTVQANGMNGSDGKEATILVESSKLVVSVTDTVYYTGLVPNETYTLEGTLVSVSKDEITKVTQASIQVVADPSGSGTWIMDFGIVEGMKSEGKYVVYEKATSEYNLIDTDKDGVPDVKDYCEHVDPSDKAQTIVLLEPEIPNIPVKPEPEDNSLGGTLRTTIVADGVEGSSSSPAIITDKDAIDAGISVKDIVYYEDLVPGETYILEGTLMHIVDGKAEPVAGAYKRQYVVASSTGSGQWEVNFGVVQGLQMGETYVVYEKATSVELLEDTDNDKKPDTKHVITHENPNDKAQTLSLKNPEPEKPEKPEEPKKEKPTTPSNNKKKGSLRTTVVAAGQTGSSDKAVWVPSRYEKTDANIKDIVYYTNLIPNAKYELEATLMHVRSDGSVTPVRGATVRKIVVADRTGNGVWEVDFGVVKDLVKEEKYVVYEKATSVNYVIDTDRDDLFDSKHIVLHQDPNDTAQTIFVKSEKAVGFYLKGQMMPMEEDMTLLGNPKDDKKNDTHLSLFGRPQPDFGYVEDPNLNYPSNNRLPQTGSILSNAALLFIGIMITMAGAVLLVPRRKQNK